MGGTPHISSEGRVCLLPGGEPSREIWVFTPEVGGRASRMASASPTCLGFSSLHFLTPGLNLEHRGPQQRADLEGDREGQSLKSWGGPSDQGASWKRQPPAGPRTESLDRGRQGHKGIPASGPRTTGLGGVGSRHLSAGEAGASGHWTPCPLLGPTPSPGLGAGARPSSFSLPTRKRPGGAARDAIIGGGFDNPPH